MIRISILNTCFDKYGPFLDQFRPILGHFLPFFHAIFREFFVSLFSRRIFRQSILRFSRKTINCATLIIGPRGCGKSLIVQRLAEILGYDLEPIMLYQDMTARDLLQQRTTLPNGDTVWRFSPLVEAGE